MGHRNRTRMVLVALATLLLFATENLGSSSQAAQLARSGFYEGERELIKLLPPRKKCGDYFWVEEPRTDPPGLTVIFTTVLQAPGDVPGYYDSWSFSEKKLRVVLDERKNEFPTVELKVERGGGAIAAVIVHISQRGYDEAAACLPKL